ncbi:uncharacterized protein LOC129582037 [Paramacrobiotus metropolitanus]|uniref:uncharacterized protein LOC129582037 n=1 Tax=Paramacrobiotus metropolitanus TaxID=2943436 RepID=UPI00244576D0|nr:uncharacterized protein LOC129582037 [Paramacrobiotus metropolitanus]XP_055329382.1 uncharacterized protein LOC129582037 [Paramacrobiotus metropolitanus]XP_055329383.1 uncharacterized protein LOC129582037 [Paramacrobiotus metropolitanus]XP_055329385.1 uncharacterized protein LOC129582037 [Paramacrobiotus metropolitanus]
MILHYDTPMFTGAGSRAFLKANQTYRGSESYRAKNDLFELAMQERAKRGCLNDSAADIVDVHLGNMAAQWTILSRTNGSYSQIVASPLSFALTVNKELYVGQLNLNSLKEQKYGDRYHMPSRFENLYAAVGKLHWSKTLELDPQYSFRMYLDRPLHVQLMPLLESVLTQRLNRTLQGDRQFAQELHVVLWDLDPEGYVVNFFVLGSYSSRSPVLALDARLTYAQIIYDKLNNASINLNTTEFNNTYTLSKAPPVGLTEDGKRRYKSIVTESCQNGISDEECPVDSTFSLYVESAIRDPFSYIFRRPTETSVFPNSSTVLNIVQTAFAKANPVTINGLSLTIALTERDDTLQTVEGFDAAKYTFSISYPNMDTGRYWKLWRYPSISDLNLLLNTTAAVRVVESRTF